MDTAVAFLRDRDFSTRLGVTLVALAVFQVGCWVPLPGLDVAVFAAQMPGRDFGAALQPASIMALGMTPVLSALILVEMTKVFWPGLRAWAVAPRNGLRLERGIAAGALLLAGLQAGGLARAYEGVAGLVPQPGLGFRAGIAVSLVAATAVLIWFASVISRRGIGNGFWVLLIAPMVATAADRVAVRYEWGTFGSETIVLSVGLLVVCIAVFAALVRARPVQTDPNELAWASILGFTLAGWLMTAAWIVLFFLAPAPHSGLLASLNVFVLLGSIGMALIVVMRRRSVGLPNAAEVASAVPVIAALIAIVAFGTTLSHIAEAPLILPTTKVLLLAAASLIVVEGLARPEFEPAATLSTSGATSTSDPQS